MALPKLGVPTYELTLPSTGKTVKYRPFLVKEEKILLLALESEDEKEIVSAVKSTLRSCVLSRVKVDQLPSFDLEYLFPSTTIYSMTTSTCSSARINLLSKGNIIY